MDPHGFHSITLGCKLNQFDTAAIEGELADRGFHRQPDVSRAAVVIVNTCTVTHRADADARRRIRQVRRANPDCRLLVTGCYAERDAGTLRRLGNVDRVFGNRDKPHLARILDELGIGAPQAGAFDTVDAASDRGCDAALALPAALHFAKRSRAFLRVQEGCRLACSYCIIPAVRGPSRSVALDDVLRAAEALFRAGYREIVLTGVNSGDYGRDLTPPTNLAALLRALLERCGPNRIRLNSLEPLTVTDEIIDLMAGDPRLAPHLQVPLQSGSDEILRLMRRNYRVETYRGRLERMRRAVPDIGLGADVIVGFPGETDERFGETYATIAASELTYLHVFSWSPRPGTPAAELAGRVHSSVIRDRSQRLRSLAADLSARFRRRFVGHQLDAVALAPRAGDGQMRALTGNFIEVLLHPGSAAAGSPVLARIDGVRGAETRATATGVPEWAAAGAQTTPDRSTGSRLVSLAG